MKNTWRLLSSGMKLFYYLWVLRHKRRDTHSFYSGFFICPPPSRAAPVARKFVWLRRASKSHPYSPEAGLNSTQLNSLTFSKSLKSSARLRCVTSPALCIPVSHLGYCDISEWHVHSARARAWTPASMLHLSNPCTEPKGSQPN